MKRLVFACLIVGGMQGRAADVSRIELLPLETVVPRKNSSSPDRLTVGPSPSRRSCDSRPSPPHACRLWSCCMGRVAPMRGTIGGRGT